MIKLLILCLALFTNFAFAQTVNINGHTADLFLSGNKGDSTVIYFPGCNGKDAMGAKYQDFHMEKIKAQWKGKVNIVRLQLVNDLTQGAQNGSCFWDTKTANERGLNSYKFSNIIGDIATQWVPKQDWYNGNIHFFGFSYGGRVAMFVNSVRATDGAFKTVTSIWPICIEAQRFAGTTVHTPTRIYGGERDPISTPKNCPTFYQNTNSNLELVLYDTDKHSWMTHPTFTNQRVWWPNHKLWTESAYDAELADKTWASWTVWAKSKEIN